MIERYRMKIGGKDSLVDIDEITTCPSCGKGIKPVYKEYCYYTNPAYSTRIAVIYQCPICCEPIVIGYECFYNAKGYYTTHCLFVAPNKFIGELYSNRISGISKQFTEIYDQALHAESLGLNHIAGMGFRKAVEFLIKDFLITRFPDKADEIKKHPSISFLIKQYIKNPRLEIIAERAAWLGNDQVHYIQKHTDKDLDAYKEVIALCVNTIEQELIYEELEAMEKK